MKDIIMNKHKIINLILSSIGILGIIFSLAVSIYDYVLETKAIKVTSTIKEINPSTLSTTAKVEYEVDSKQYQTNITFLGGSSYAVNDKITIKIDIYNPVKTIDNEHYYITIPIVFVSVIFCIISLRKSVKYIKDYKNRKNLKQNGMFINAPISEIFINTNAKKIKGAYPYHLRCKYQNPLDQKLYIFDSDDTFNNLEQIVRQNNNRTIVVYIEKNHPENYFVDLSSLVPQPRLIDPIEFMKSSPKVENPASEETKEENKEDQKEDKETQEEKKVENK